MPNCILRIAAARARAGISRTALYERIARGTWPRPVRIGVRAIGWPSLEIDAIVAAYIAGYDNDRLRALVDRLHAARAGALESVMARADKLGTLPAPKVGPHDHLPGAA
jgi:prophage regulatory protein